MLTRRRRTGDDTSCADEEKPVPVKRGRPRRNNVSPAKVVQEEPLDEVKEEPLKEVKEEPLDDCGTSSCRTSTPSRAWYCAHMKSFCPREKRREELCWHDSLIASGRFSAVFDLLAEKCPPKTSWRDKVLYQCDGWQIHCWMCFGEVELNTKYLLIRSPAQKTSHIGYMVHEACLKALKNSEQSPDALASNFAKAFRKAIPKEIIKPITARLNHSHVKIKTTTVADFISYHCSYTAGKKCLNPCCEKANDHKEIVHCDNIFCSKFVHYSCLDKVDNIIVSWQNQSWTCETHREGATSFVLTALNVEREHNFYFKYPHRDDAEWLKNLCSPTSFTPLVKDQCVICVERGVSEEDSLVPRIFIPTYAIILACCENERFVHMRCLQGWLEELKRLGRPPLCPSRDCDAPSDFVASILGAQGVKMILYPRRSKCPNVLYSYALTPEEATTTTTASTAVPTTASTTAPTTIARPERTVLPDVQITQPTNTKKSPSVASEEVITLDDDSDEEEMESVISPQARENSPDVVTIDDDDDEDNAVEEADENVQKEREKKEPPVLPRSNWPIFSAPSTPLNRRSSPRKTPRSTAVQPSPKTTPSRRSTLVNLDQALVMLNIKETQN